jgi:hypothetical protein
MAGGIENMQIRQNFEINSFFSQSYYLPHMKKVEFFPAIYSASRYKDVWGSRRH